MIFCALSICLTFSRTTSLARNPQARFLELGFNKAVAIDLPRDLKEVLVADPKTVTVVVRTMRRVYIIGAVLGNTNVFFYDDDGRQIAALDVCVSEYHHPRNDKSGIGSKGATIAAAATAMVLSQP